jgi:flagellar motor switch protein FliG
VGGYESLQARQAALLLHGLPSAARREVVARLTASESARIRLLLAELEELGVSQSLGRQLREVATPIAPSASVEERIARLEAGAAARALQLCAPETAACLLRNANWPWKAEALSLMSETGRSRVLEQMRRPMAPLAPAVLRALYERLVFEASLATLVRSPRSALKRWLGWTR